MKKKKEHDKRDYERIERAVPKVTVIRRERINIRVTKLEKDIIEDNAKPLSVANYLRTIGQKKRIKPILGKEFFDLVQQIRKFGNNHNQITKLLHSNIHAISDYNNLDTLLKQQKEITILLQEVKDTYLFLGNLK
jgi:Mobilization protein NikA